MYKVKPFESFDMSDVKLPGTMYKMNPVYGKSFERVNKQIGNDNQEPASKIEKSLIIQTKALKNLNLSAHDKCIELILHLPYTSILYSFFSNLKSELKDKLDIHILENFSSFDQKNNELFKRWFSLISTSTCQVDYILQIKLESNDFTQTCLFQKDSSLKLSGEINILVLLNEIIKSSMSVQANCLDELIHKLLLNEYLDYLQQSVNIKKFDQSKIECYKNNLNINSRILDIADLIYKNELRLN